MSCNIATTLCTLIFAAGTVACSKDAEDATKAGEPAPALAVVVSAQGEGQVTLDDEMGRPVSTRGVTGRFELAGGETVPLTPDQDGRTLKAPLAGYLGDSKHGCMAKVRITMPRGTERTQDVDLCREHGRHGGAAGHAGLGGMGPGGMGPSGMGPGRTTGGHGD